MHRGASDGVPGEDGILTVLEDASGQVHGVHEPNAAVAVSITVPELLRLAGASHALAEPNPYVGPNALPRAQRPEGGIGRITQ